MDTGQTRARYSDRRNLAQSVAELRCEWGDGSGLLLASAGEFGPRGLASERHAPTVGVIRVDDLRADLAHLRRLARREEPFLRVGEEREGEQVEAVA